MTEYLRIDMNQMAKDPIRSAFELLGHLEKKDVPDRLERIIVYLLAVDRNYLLKLREAALAAMLAPEGKPPPPGAASKIAGLLADIDRHLPDDYDPNSYMVCPGCFTMAYRDDYLLSRIAHKYACGCGRTWCFGVERRRTACTVCRKRRMCSVIGDNKTCGKCAQDIDNVLAHYVGDSRCEVCGTDKSVRWVKCLKRDCEVCLCQTCAEDKPDNYELDFGEDGSLSAYHLSSMEHARLMADCDRKRRQG